jgi:hypothetical protein
VRAWINLVKGTFRRPGSQPVSKTFDISVNLNLDRTWDMPWVRSGRATSSDGSNPLDAFRCSQFSGELTQIAWTERSYSGAVDVHMLQHQEVTLDLDARDHFDSSSGTGADKMDGVWLTRKNDDRKLSAARATGLIVFPLYMPS